MNTSQLTLFDSYDYRGFGADNIGIYDNDGMLYSWPDLARLQGKYLVADMDMFAAHLIRDNAPVHILANHNGHIVKVVLNNSEYVSLERFGYSLRQSGVAGARYASSMRAWLAMNGWRLRSSLGSTGLYDVLPSFLHLRKIGRKAMWLQDWRAKMLEPLSLAGREYAIPGSYSRAYSYDVNSAYGSVCMDTPLPYPPRLKVFRPTKPKEAYYYIRLFNGAAKVRVNLPDDTYGILATKTKEGLDWNNSGGIVEGTYTTNELRYAIELGATIEHCDWIMYANTNDTYLADFVEAAYDEKLAAEIDGDMIGRKFWKLLINATIGRFSASGGLVLCERLPYGQRLPRKAPKGYLGFMPINLDTIFLTKPAKIANLGSNRLWTAIIVSEQRCRIHRAATVNRAIYVDTDCIITLEPANLAVGSQLGQWSHKGAGRVDIRAPKVYNGTWEQAHARGIPAAVAAAFVAGETVTFSRRRSWRVAEPGAEEVVTLEARNNERGN